MSARATRIERVFLGLLAANLAVVGAKVFIGIRAGSLAVLGDAVHSSADALNNILFIALTRFAARAPDDDHPYGHGKFEVLGALAILVFLCVSGFELVKGAIHRLATGSAAPDLSTPDLALLGATLLVNGWVAWFESRKGRELGSDLLLADAAHTRADVLITLGVIGGGGLSSAGVRHVDPITAIVIALLMVRIGWDIVRRAVPALVDEVARAPEAIRGVAQQVDGVASAYAIRSRWAGAVTFAELTIGVRGDLAVARAHDIADAVETRLKGELALDEVVVHIEPC
jgi:cation diffusion facilitator family transporter